MELVRVRSGWFSQAWMQTRHDQAWVDDPTEASQLMNLARLLKRVLDIDRQHCPNCGSDELKIIAAILERPVIGTILTSPGPGSAATAQGQAHEAGHDVAA